MRCFLLRRLLLISLIGGITSVAVLIKISLQLSPKNPSCNTDIYLAKATIVAGIIFFLGFSYSVIRFLARKSHWLVNIIRGLLILSYLCFAVVTILSLAILFMYLSPQNNCVPKDYGFISVVGKSMEPTLEPGKVIYANLIKEPLKRDCLVVANVNKYAKQFPGAGDKDPVIKRIIAVPGDKLAFSRGDVFLNGKLITEPFINDGGTWLWPEGKIKENATISLEPNSYFIMGDNRGRSADSRLYGPINFNDIIGYANDPVHLDLNTCH